MCRLAAAHNTHRLMLLGLPPDMVHGVLLHRAHTSIFRNPITDLTSRRCSVIMIPHFRSFVKNFFINNFSPYRRSSEMCNVFIVGTRIARPSLNNQPSGRPMVVPTVVSWYIHVHCGLSGTPAPTG